MNKTRLTKFMSMLLAIILIVSMVPVTSLAATSGNEDNVIFFATDLHDVGTNFTSLLGGLEYAPGLVALGGDHVANWGTGNLEDVASLIHTVYPNAQAFHTYASHDEHVSEDSSNKYAFARTGEVYKGKDYYVYPIDQGDMSSVTSAGTASKAFLKWAEGVNDGKVIFVLSHMPLHARRKDNSGGATWMKALNEAADSHDIVFLWGHNHTGETSADTAVYYVAPGGSITPQGGDKDTIQFTYMNAGYIREGYASMIVINDDTVSVTRYYTNGKTVSAQKTYTIDRCYPAIEHRHSYTIETVPATCLADGSATYTCTCGDTYTEVIPALGHEYETVTVDATCEDDGLVTYTCHCGDTYTEEVPALGHDMQMVSQVDSTCDKAGSTKYACSVCGDTMTVRIPAKGHKDEVYTVPATCEREGYEITICTVCGREEEKILPATDHSYEVEIVDPTCEENGIHIYTCTTCGNSYEDEGRAALGHKYETVTISATCEEGGCKVHTCATCGKSYTTDVTPALGHKYEAVTVPATCEEDGSVTYTCSACEDSYVEVLPALGHDYKTVIVPATCETDGFATYACVTCGDYSEEVLPALGHKYETVTVPATCETDGSVTYTCHCGNTYAEVLPALGHNYVETVVAPNCVLAGGTTHTCMNCGDRYITDEVPALGHNYRTITVEANCTTAGYTAHICMTCNDSYITNRVEALGHDYSAVTTAPTCGRNGKTVYTCQCGHSYTESIPALGHQFVMKHHEATCIMSGYTEYTCTSCGESHVGNFSSPKGHTYECEEIGDYLHYTCVDCGDSYSEKKEAVYTYDKATSFGNGNQYVITFYASKKYYALTHTDGEIGIEQVTVSNGQVTSEVTEDMLWNYKSKKISYEEDGTTYYLYAADAGVLNLLKAPELELSTSKSSSCSISSNKIKVGSYYLRYSSGDASLNRSSGSTAYIYIKNEQ